ncbi:MAG TPA: ZIP family zinc transporter [Dehalococcoidia bacterium]|nr:ZIP family zinc transporter [Dehalococcoidia bacterium]
MLEAFAWGIFAASSLIIGGAIALRFQISTFVIGLVMAFGAGVLISAVAYELVLEAYLSSAGFDGVGIGLAAGALTFFVGDALIDRMGGHNRKAADGPESGSSPLAIVLGIVLDGIPESVVLGLTLVAGEGIGVAVVAAVFLSNLPEAIAATSGLSNVGWRGSRIMQLWVVVTLVSGIAALLGYAVLEDASPRTIAFVNAFAGGAILTMLADTMMPEGFKYGGKLVGLLTTLGFFLAFVLTTLE